MFVLKHTFIGNGHTVSIEATNYYRPGDGDLIIIKDRFKKLDHVRSWFVGNAHSYIGGTLDVYIQLLKGISTHIMQLKYGGTAEQRNIWMENYWKVIDLKEKFYGTSSVWERANLILDNHQIIQKSVPQDDRLQHDHFWNMAKDMVKAAAKLKGALKDEEKLHRIEQSQSWLKSKSEDIQELQIFNQPRVVA